MSSDGIYRQQDDGSWRPAEPMGWQGGPLSVDWEAEKQQDRRVAIAYHHADEIARVEARSKRVLGRRMRRAARKWRRKQRRAGVSET